MLIVGVPAAGPPERPVEVAAALQAIHEPKLNVRLEPDHSLVAAALAHPEIADAQRSRRDRLNAVAIHGEAEVNRTGLTAARDVATLGLMKMATSTRIEVGVRDLKNNLSRYLDHVEAGVEVVVTDRGRPIARLNGIDEEPTDKLAALIEAGLVRPPTSRVRQRPVPLHASGSVSELVAEQRQ
jgi:prevent-host-death family protein